MMKNLDLIENYMMNYPEVNGELSYTDYPDIMPGTDLLDPNDLYDDTFTPQKTETKLPKSLQGKGKKPV